MRTVSNRYRKSLKNHKKNNIGLYRRTFVAGLFGTIIIFTNCTLALFLPVPLYVKILIMVPALFVPFLLIFNIKMLYAADIETKEKDALLYRVEQKKVTYLEHIIQNSNDIIFTVDREHYILKFNEGAQSYFGYTQEEVLGKPLTLLFESRRIASLIEKMKKTGSVINEVISAKTKEGNMMVLILNISRMNFEINNIDGYVLTAKDITEKKQLEDELRQKNEQLSLLAITDSLTGLYNLRHFYAEIKRELKRFRRKPDRALSLLLIDIDRFKELNDTEGHQMGDAVLHALAEIIQSCIREDIDSGYRYGGDEFVVMLPDTNKSQANVVAQRIRKQYMSFKFGNTDLSIGVTEAEAGDNEESIVKRADDAMYKRKRRGRGTVPVYINGARKRGGSVH